MNKAEQKRANGETLQIAIPPHSIEAEQTTLGCLMIDRGTWPTISQIITEADFYNANHRLIYHAASELASKGGSLDPSAIGDWLEEHQLLEDAGGFKYLGRISLDTPTAANADWHAKRVRHHSLKRKRLAALAQNDEDQVATITATIKTLETGCSGLPPSFIEVSELCQLPPAENWLIKSYLTTDSLCLLFGDPGCGKSFLAIDMACHVATGLPWRGQSTRQGKVLYIAGEGRNGLAKRFKAWFEHTGETPQNIVICNTPIQLTVSSNTADLANRIKAMQDPPKLIVIDTINRNYGPGDENDTADMTHAVTSLDILRSTTGATILGVHHSGHAEKGRSRGSSVLQASLDCEFAIEKFDRTVQMRCTKAKDFDHPPPLSWNFERQNLPWGDEAGAPMNSAVLVLNELPGQTAPVTTRMGQNQRKALEIIQKLQARNHERRGSAGFEVQDVGVDKSEWYKEMEAAGIARNRRTDVKADLERRGLIHEVGDRFIYLTEHHVDEQHEYRN